MYEWVANLLDLQEKDNRIGKLQEQIDSVPSEKAKLNSLMHDADEALAAAKHLVQDREKAIKSLEIKVDTVNAKRQDFEAKSTMIKDNDEYKAAMHQIETCRDQVRKLEDEELVLMEELEEARGQLQAARKQRDAAEKRVAQVIQDLDTRLQNCTTQIEKLKGERAAAVALVPGDVAKRYERIMASRRASRAEAVAFAAIRNESCMGCHMKVTPQTRTNASKGMVVSCSQCGVLLYLDQD